MFKTIRWWVSAVSMCVVGLLVITPYFVAEGIAIGSKWVADKIDSEMTEWMESL